VRTILFWAACAAVLGSYVVWRSVVYERIPVANRRYRCEINLVGNGGRYPNRIVYSMTPGSYAAFTRSLAAGGLHTFSDGTTLSIGKVTHVNWNGPSVDDDPLHAIHSELEETITQ
jgi:hypothetical protein